jgi:hypothetical protein
MEIIMSTHGSLLAATALAFLAFLTGGCGSTDSGSPGTAIIVSASASPSASAGSTPSVTKPLPPATSDVLQRTSEALESPSHAQLPAGHVPDAVVGRWTGGAGAKTGEYLVIEPDGSYARINRRNEVYRQGVIVMNGNDLVTYDTDGRQEMGSWDYTNAAGIEVLAVYFGPDYYSYVRA